MERRALGHRSRVVRLPRRRRTLTSRSEASAQAPAWPPGAHQLIDGVGEQVREPGAHPMIGASSPAPRRLPGTRGLGVGDRHPRAQAPPAHLPTHSGRRNRRYWRAPSILQDDAAPRAGCSAQYMARRSSGVALLEDGAEDDGQLLLVHLVDALLAEAVPLCDGDVALRERQDLALLEVEVLDEGSSETIEDDRRARPRGPDDAVRLPCAGGAARRAPCGPRRRSCCACIVSTSPVDGAARSRRAAATGPRPRRCGGGAGRRGPAAPRRRAGPPDACRRPLTSRTSRRAGFLSSRRNARWMMTISCTHGRSVVGVGAWTRWCSWAGPSRSVCFGCRPASSRAPAHPTYSDPHTTPTVAVGGAPSTHRAATRRQSEGRNDLSPSAEGDRHVTRRPRSPAGFRLLVHPQNASRWRSRRFGWPTSTPGRPAASSTISSRRRRTALSWMTWRNTCQSIS